ncbi:MAG TPA: prolipoprotein diacylglyceryl transferase [Prolixibacteraceae bacterium]|nr:prolipoprotein diacylglyceryl transferase [Prolixibacteraceae bacterium]
MPDGITIHSYPFFFVLGVIFASIYCFWRFHVELQVTFKQIIISFNAVVISSFLGAKLFGIMKFHLSGVESENPNGLILYGAIVFVIPVLYFITKYQKLSFSKTMDIMAMTFPILFVFIRTGCFLAGCCYGIPTHSFFGVVFTDPHCSAEPKGIPLHPTQLYSIILFLFLIGILLLIKRKQKFDGQLFLVFLMIYAIGRGLIEMFRGDGRRGIIIEGILTYSQLISVLIFIAAIVFYIRLWRKASIQAPR